MVQHGPEKILFFFITALFLLVMIISCAKPGETSPLGENISPRRENVPGGETSARVETSVRGGSVLDAEIPLTEDGAAGQGETSADGGNAPGGSMIREAVLIRGNYWAPGVSGFGANGFSALTGEYRLEGLSPQSAGEEGSGGFSVYFTREPLYFSNEWQLRPGIPGIQVFERGGDEGFIAAAVMDDGGGVFWTAVFRFPLGLAEAGLDAGDFNQMLPAWIRRISYFLSFAKTAGDLSLPAVVEF